MLKREGPQIFDGLSVQSDFGPNLVASIKAVNVCRNESKGVENRRASHHSVMDTISGGHGMDFDLFGLGVVDDARPRLFLRRLGCGQSVLNTMMMSVIAMGIGALLGGSWLSIGLVKGARFGSRASWPSRCGRRRRWSGDSSHSLCNVPNDLCHHYSSSDLKMVERMRFSAYVCHHALVHRLLRPALPLAWGRLIGAWGVLDLRAAPWSHRARFGSGVCNHAGTPKHPRSGSSSSQCAVCLAGGGCCGLVGLGSPGSALAADETAAMAVMTTTLAAAAAMMAWTTLSGVNAGVHLRLAHDWCGGIGHDHPGRCRLADGHVAMGVLGSAAAFYAIVCLPNLALTTALMSSPVTAWRPWVPC